MHFIQHFETLKMKYTFTTGETIETDLEGLECLLAENRQYLENYIEVFNSLDDEEYVARGNGFCDRKYSDDFIERQIAKYQQRVNDLERWILESKNLDKKETHEHENNTFKLS